MAKYLFLTLPILLMILSCQKPSNKVKDQFQVNTTNITLSGEVNALDSIELQATISWNVTITPATATWLRVGTSNGSGNKVILITTVEKNLTASRRSATITITPVGSSLVPQTITIIQNTLTPQLITDSTSLTLSSSNNATDSFTILSNIDWRITSSAAWITVSNINGTNNSKIFVTTNESNISAVERTATLTIAPVGTTAVQPKTITINQKPTTLLISWSKLLGGSANDETHSIAATSDGGYFMVGNTPSGDGDISSAKGFDDAWVVKVNANGNKLWSKVFGGAGTDIAWSVIATADGGCIFAGSTSSNDGDVSGNRGRIDGWLVKLDLSGNIQWSKLFGGQEAEGFRSIIATPGGGYVLAGNTNSTDGDAVGNNGFNNAWIVKVDESGNKLWSKVAVASEPLAKQINAATATADGGYIMVGNTTSRLLDAWVVKVDANGTHQWSKAYGGTDWDDTKSVIATADGGCILAGGTVSIDGDIGSNHGLTDAWLTKLTPTGNLQWSKTFGGTANDFANSIIKSSDGGFVIVGFTKSSDGDLSNHNGENDIWMMKLNENMDKIWSRSFGGKSNDSGESIIATIDGGYIFTGSSWSNDGDLSGNHGNMDSFIIKLVSQ